MKLIKDLGVMKYPETAKSRRRWGIYECPDCLKHFHVQTTNVKSGKSTKCRSCSAKKCNVTHGLHDHPLYNVWSKMKSRCYNRNNKDYSTYGAEGVTVCKEWKEDFEKFYKWSMENGWEPGLQIDKDILCRQKNIHPFIYSPSTCMYISSAHNAQATRRINASNTSGYRGVALKTTDRWQAQISVNGKKVFIGYAGTAEAAARMYDQYVIDNNLNHTRNFSD